MAPVSMKEELQQFWSQQCADDTSPCKPTLCDVGKSSAQIGALELQKVATPCKAIAKTSANNSEAKNDDPNSSTQCVAKKRKARWDELPPAMDISKVSLTSKTSIRPNIGGWDKTTGGDQIAVPKLLTPSSNPTAKKRREVYMGNLPLGQVNCETLQRAVRKLFEILPEFLLKYPDVHEPVRSVLIPANSTGMFAFVELYDECLANTAIQMTGFELLGRAIKVGRPAGHETLPETDKVPLDVEPLRRRGLIPDLGAQDPQSLLARELYFGNLAIEHVNQETMMELLTTVCEQHPSYDESKGPAITHIHVANSGFYCFVQFQTSEMASCMLEVFEETDFCGRTMRVRRPSNYTQALSSLPVPPPPVLPPPACTQPLANEGLCSMASSQLLNEMGVLPPPPPQLLNEMGVLPPPPPQLLNETGLVPPPPPPFPAILHTEQKEVMPPPPPVAASQFEMPPPPPLAALKESLPPPSTPMMVPPPPPPLPALVEQSLIWNLSQGTRL